jgi:hypothetical protein
MTEIIIEEAGRETFLAYAERPPSIRETPEYLAMDAYRAVGIAEQWLEFETEAEIGAAWQFLYDNPSIACVLAGSLNQQFERLIEEGLIEA